MCRREPEVSPYTQSTIFLSIYYIPISDTTEAIQSAQIEVDLSYSFIKFNTIKILSINLIHALISENYQIISL